MQDPNLAREGDAACISGEIMAVSEMLGRRLYKVPGPRCLGSIPTLDKRRDKSLVKMHNLLPQKHSFSIYRIFARMNFLRRHCWGSDSTLNIIQDCKPKN